MDKFNHVDTWVFDLDHTLYDAESHVFPEMHRTMTKFVSEHLCVSMEKADIMRNDFYQRYGSTLAGIMAEHSIDPEAFMEQTHQIDISAVTPCPVISERINHLQGRKIIFTNAPLLWAERMLEHLNLTHHFDGIATIEDSNYKGKPHIETYKIFLNQHKVNPKTSCMFEDSVHNLKAAHDLGMSTVWLHGGKGADHDYVHHKANTLTEWLSSIKTQSQ